MPKGEYMLKAVQLIMLVQAFIIGYYFLMLLKMVSKSILNLFPSEEKENPQVSDTKIPDHIKMN
jgi:hypothetical protein